jgi:hypothetical protein
VGFYSTTGNNWGVTVSGNHAYLAKGGNGLQVIDVSDPTSPTLAGSYNTTGDSRAVAVSGDHAFVADGGSGIQVIDISDPTTPTLDGNYDTPGWALDIVISGDHAFMAGGANGLQVIAISDPTTPTLAGSWDSPIDAWGVAVSGDRAYLADDDSGLQVIDISDPTNPTPVGSYNTTGNAYGVAVSGHHAFVADRASGLQVIRVAQDDGVVANDRGQSLAVDAADDAVIRARLTVVQTSNVSWELSADAGANWLAKSPPYDSWTRFTVPGNDLLWRTTHMWSLGVNPTVSNLTLEWLNGHGLQYLPACRRPFPRCDVPGCNARNRRPGSFGAIRPSSVATSGRERRHYRRRGLCSRIREPRQRCILPAGSLEACFDGIRNAIRQLPR